MDAYGQMGLNETFMELKRRFADFLEHEPVRDDPYKDRIEALFDDAPKDEGRNLRLLVDVHDLQSFDTELHRRTLTEPCECIRPLEEALRDAAKNLNEYRSEPLQDLAVGFIGELGPHKVSPRKLLSSFLNQMVCIVGIVTKASLVHPKVVRSTHYSETTKKFITREYYDESNFGHLPTAGNAMPTKDEDGNLLTTEVGLCKFIDNQRVTLQELPETAPPGQLPRSCEFVLEGDLVDACKPGDRVMITGVFKPIGAKSTANLTGVFRSIVIANSVQLLSKAVQAAADITAADLREMKSLASKPKVLDVLGMSMAPSIYGHEWIKKALILLLVGGQEKNLINKTHLRGDINCLLVGDPGVAKSQLLRAVMNVASLAVSTNGRGSSGVGLTAAVTHDSDTGERRLEAGAVVLADRGIVCVDEFDKMNDVDRVAIHEVMEQQTVTIAKAGVQTSLNARVSIVAAANPIYGTIDETISLTRNINLPDSLLSRFDLLFVVRDLTDERIDKTIAQHVLGQHRYRRVGDDGTLAPVAAEEMLEEDEEDGEAPPQYVKHNDNLHGSLGSDVSILSVPFLRKYLYYAKTKFARQELTQEAFEEISQFYVEIRQAAATGILDPRDRPIPVTPRSLETMIRLATAHSKLRFSKKIEFEDVEVARDIIMRIINQSRAVPEDDAGAEPAHAELHEVDLEARRATTRSAAAAAPTEAALGGDEDMEVDTENAARENLPAPSVGDKRTKRGQTAKRSSRSTTKVGEEGTQGAGGIHSLTRETEAQLYAAVNEMLFEQRYVDEWKVAGVSRWLQENKGITVSDDLLCNYFDRADQNLTEDVPRVLYDAAQKAVHRDY